MKPFFVLQLCVAPGDGEGMGVQPVLAWDPSLPPEQLPMIAAALGMIAADFAAMYPPTDEVVENVAKAKAAGMAINEAQQVIAAAEAGA